MLKNYLLKVNENYKVSCNDLEINNMDILLKEEGVYQLINADKNYTVKTLNSDFSKKEYQIVVNGNKYHVKIENELDELIQKMGLTLNDKKKEKDVKAPMPGLILDILVKEGQEIKEGDSLIVLEAMKMENMLIAAADGVVKEIHVKKTDSVEKKQLLIEIE